MKSINEENLKLKAQKFIMFTEVTLDEFYALDGTGTSTELIDANHFNGTQAIVGFMKPSERNWFRHLHDWCEIFVENPPRFVMVKMDEESHLIRYFGCQRKKLIFIFPSSHQHPIIDWLKSEPTCFVKETYTF